MPTTVSRIVSIWHLTEGSGIFQKVVDRPVNIGYFNRVLWISLADSDPRLQCVFLRNSWAQWAKTPLKPPSDHESDTGNPRCATFWHLPNLGVYSGVRGSRDPLADCSERLLHEHSPQRFPPLLPSTLRHVLHPRCPHRQTRKPAHQGPQESPTTLRSPPRNPRAPRGRLPLGHGLPPDRRP